MEYVEKVFQLATEVFIPNWELWIASTGIFSLTMQLLLSVSNQNFFESLKAGYFKQAVFAFTIPLSLVSATVLANLIGEATIGVVTLNGSNLFLICLAALPFFFTIVYFSSFKMYGTYLNPNKE